MIIFSSNEQLTVELETLWTRKKIVIIALVICVIVGTIGVVALVVSLTVSLTISSNPATANTAITTTTAPSTTTTISKKRPHMIYSLYIPHNFNEFIKFGNF